MENTDNGPGKPEATGGAGESNPLKEGNLTGNENAGRPAIVFDYLQLEKLCHINATHREIAAYFDCSVETVQRRVKDDPRFAAAMERGYMGGWMSLRRKQMEIALEGNPTMMIWLGKNILGQRDNLDTKLTGSGPNGEIEHNVSPLELLERGIARINDRKRTPGDLGKPDGTSAT